MQRHYEFIWLDFLIMFKHFSDDFRWICSVVSIGFCRLMEWWSYTVSDNQWYYKWRDKQLWQGVYCSVLFIGYKALRDGSKCFKLPKFKNKSSGHSGCFFLLHNILTPILSQMSHPFSSKMNLFHVDFFMICPNWYIMCLTQSDLHFSWKLDLRGYDDQVSAPKRTGRGSFLTCSHHTDISKHGPARMVSLSTYHWTDII